MSRTRLATPSRHRSRFRRLVCGILLGLLAHQAAGDDALDYAVVDPGHTVVRLDTADTESFLGLALDSEGRIFTGTRSALFVYEPRADGTYAPRQELLRLPDHTWVYDVVIRGDDLYLLTVSALYIVPNGRIERAGLEAHRLVWGLPLGHVHQCFHGLAIGPDGDLYFNSGDPLWYYGDFSRPDHWGHWTLFSKAPGAAWNNTDWVRTPYTGVGAVFRCRPDGSGLQVYARGLRNSCGLAFDHDWNLFTNDNDHESMPAEYVPGRLNHVTPHADFSWPRGWMKTKTPDRADLLDTLNTQLGRFVPVGQAYYDDAWLGPEYRHSLLVARWCTREITYYPLRRAGASFECEEKRLLVGRNQARPVHVAVGRGGRIFASICYMAQNEGSPVYKSDLVMITRKDDPVTRPFASYAAPRVDPAQLIAELSHDDWSRRHAAHHELLRRGRTVTEDLAGTIKQGAAPRAWPHLVHLAAAAGRADLLSPLLEAQASAGQSEVADLQAIRALAALARRSGQPHDARQAADYARKKLSSASPLVRLTALAEAIPDPAALPVDDPGTLQRLTETSAERQTLATALAEQASLETIASLSENPSLKMLGVLAAGFRLTRPRSEATVPAEAPLTAWRTDEAYFIQFADEKETLDLRKLGRLGLFTTAEHWKALPRTFEQEPLFALLMQALDDEDEPIRLQAAHFLSLLNDPRSEPRVQQVRTDTARRRLGLAGPAAVSRAWIVGPFPDKGEGFQAVHPPESGSVDLAATYPVQEKSLPWREVGIMRQINFRELNGPCDGTSSYAYFRLESGVRQTAMLSVGSDDGVKVWQNGQVIFTHDMSRGALPLQDTILIELQPGSNNFLCRVRNVSGESGLYLHYRALSPVAAVLPEKLAAGDLAARLKEAAADAGQTKVDARFLEIDWTQAAAKGNAENGRKLFSSDGLGCAKCHAATADATLNAGPSLAEARKRFTAAYLVESVLLPGKQVSPVFKATLVATKSGKTLAGLVVGETGDTLEMILTDASRVKLAKSEIEDRKLQELSPMPAGLVKTPEELRDLLAYLLSDAPRAP